MSRFRAFLIRALGVALLGTFLVSVPAHAAAGTELTVSTSPLNQSTSASCVTFPLTWFVSVPDGAENWSVSGDIINAAGASSGTVFHYEQAAVTQATENFTLCGSPGVTTYTLAAKVESIDWTYPYTGDRTVQVSTPFTITYTPPPPPPAPVPATTNVRLGDSVRFTLGKRKVLVRAVLKISYSGCGYYCSPQRRSTVQARRRDGSWPGVGTSTTSLHRLPFAVRVPYRYTHLRVSVAPLPGFTGDVSNRVKLPRRPSRG